MIDILPQEKPAAPLAPPKRQGGKGVFKSMFKKKPCESSSSVEQEYIEPDTVEEIYEEGSASLSERFVLKFPSLLWYFFYLFVDQASSGKFLCAFLYFICIVVCNLFGSCGTVFNGVVSLLVALCIVGVSAGLLDFD